MENNQSQKNNFKDRVMHDIETNHIESYSRAHFVLRMVLLIIVLIITMIVSVLILNFVFFGLRVSGRGSLLDFGWQGLLIYFEAFPWLLLCIDILLVAALAWLVRMFRFGYRVPVVYMVLGLFVLTLGFGFVLDRTTGVNDMLLHEADEHHLPGPFGLLYEDARTRPPGDGDCKCIVITINSSTIVAQNTDVNDTSSLLIIEPLGFSASATLLSTGDVIFVAGNRVASYTIQAFGIEVLPENYVPPEDQPAPGQNAPMQPAPVAQ